MSFRRRREPSVLFLPFGRRYANRAPPCCHSRAGGNPVSCSGRSAVRDAHTSVASAPSRHIDPSCRRRRQVFGRFDPRCAGPLFRALTPASPPHRRRTSIHRAVGAVKCSHGSIPTAWGPSPFVLTPASPPHRRRTSSRRAVGAVKCSGASIPAARGPSFAPSHQRRLRTAAAHRSVVPSAPSSVQALRSPLRGAPLTRLHTCIFMMSV